MGRTGSQQPTEVELEILGILWDLGPSPVRDIHAKLNSEKRRNYSTTVKMLSVMLEKGLVKRNEDASPHIYRTARSRATTGRKLVKDLMNKVYNGAAMTLVQHALDSAQATPEELREVRRLLDELEERS